MSRTYDQWKTENPFDDETEGHCAFCGIPTDDYYCSSDCKNADLE